MLVHTEKVPADLVAAPVDVQTVNVRYCLCMVADFVIVIFAYI